MKHQILKQLDQDIEYGEEKLSAMKAVYDKAPTNLVVFLCYMNVLTAAIQTYKMAIHVVEAARWADVDVSEWGDARDALLEEMRVLENANPLGPITVPNAIHGSTETLAEQQDDLIKKVGEAAKRAGWPGSAGGSALYEWLDDVVAPALAERDTLVEQTKEKGFVVYWRDGRFTQITGPTIEQAFTNAGYGAGALRALDFYEPASEATYVWDATERSWFKKSTDGESNG